MVTIGAYETAWLREKVTSEIRRFVHLSDDAALAASLWVLFTHAVEAFEVAPYLDVSSPVRECGKTRLFEVLELVCHAPRRCTGHTEATLFRMVESEHPTLLLDEIDTTFGKDPKLYAGIRGVLDEGHRRGGSVPRMVGEGKSFKIHYFDVFGPKAFAGIGQLPETVASRSIPIRLHRKPRSVRLERFRFRREYAAAAEIREAAAAWGQNVVGELTGAEPDLPGALSDRQWDLWEPLIAIAELADVGAEARAAAVTLHSAAQSDDSAGVLVLDHIREVFNGHDRMSTGDLLAALVVRDDGPWARWWAREVDAGQIKAPASRLARMLRAFDVTPKQLKIDGENVRGYEVESFREAWDRYLPDTPPNDATTLLLPRNTPSEQGSNGVASSAGVKAQERLDGVTGPCPECTAWPHQGGHFSTCSRWSA